MTSNASVGVASQRRRLALRGSRWGRWGVPAAVYAVLALLAVLAGYWLMYGQFAVYDDEGFFDYSLKLFLDGHTLYNQVFSDYGPFYYLVFGAVFKIFGHQPTTDSGRLIQLTLWVLTSLGIGAIAHRLSGRLALGAAAVATAFLLLNGATSEPMHASMLNDFCEMLLVLSLAFGLRRWPMVSLGIAGALVAALLLTKINVGGYTFIALGFAAVMSIGTFVRLWWLRMLACAALVLVGPVVMIGSLNSGWVQSYALMAGVSALSLVFVALPRHGEDLLRAGTDRWWIALIGGFVAALVVIVVIIVALGTSPGKLFNDIVTVPSHQGSVLVVPITLGSNVIWWSLASVAAAWGFRAAGGSEAAWLSGSAWWPGLVRALAGVAILLSLASQSIFNVAPDAAFALAMPLAWVAAIPSRRDPVGAATRLLRTAVPALAISEALLSYPVAGTQMGYGSILLVLCGAVCIADGWADLAVWERMRRPAGPFGVSAIVAALCAALAVGAAFSDLLQPMESNHNEYRSFTALTIPGASRLHLPAGTASGIQQTVAALQGNGCKTLVGYPGMYSFDLWTGLPYVTAQTGEQPYWTLLTHAQQLEVLQTAKRTPDLCLVRNDTLASDYGGNPGASPLVQYLEQAFTPIASYGPYQVELRKSAVAAAAKTAAKKSKRS
jgi:hypothetical protein